MFKRQERMLRRQEQQRLAKDAKIQRRIWDPGIKSIQDNTLGEGGFERVRNDMPVDKHMDFMMGVANPNDLNKARPDQVLEESTSHTSDKVEVVSTSMVATYEKHGCQDGLKPITTTFAAGKKGDLGAISSKGGPPDHMQASEKELAVLKSPLKEKSMSMRQERMLRRQEQQRLAKDAKIQRRIWDPAIKIF
ncbi:hypothetical protein Tco_1011224 [Tanacetum coccineum]